MDAGLFLQGRYVSPDDIGLIRKLIAEHPLWHRTQLSQELCRRWGWTNAKGHLKDMAARSVLRKLDARGLIELPAAVRSANNALRHRVDAAVGVEPRPITGSLDAVQPLRILPVRGRSQSQLFRALLCAHHYLGYGGPVGENLRYLVFDREERALGCLLFGAAAWRVACRDRFIGWDPSARAQGLSRIANNMRFLILPWVRVPHLASHLLGQVSRRVSTDWQRQYGHRIALLETFVDTERFRGTCYAAANWLRVGETTGRSRNSRHKRPQVPIKAVWLYPLGQHFRAQLGAPERAACARAV